MSKWLIIFLMSAASVFGQATGYVWLRWETVTCDSIDILKTDDEGEHLIKKVFGTGIIDTADAAANLRPGANTFTAKFWYPGSDSAVTGSLFFNNIATGSLPAAGELRLNFGAATLYDTIMVIHMSPLGDRDTMIWLNTWVLDMALLPVELPLGIHNYVIRLKYSGDDNWYAGPVIYHNSAGAGVGAPTGFDMCRAYGYVTGVDSLPVEGATVTAVLPISFARDTCAGTLIGNYRVRATTNSAGYFFMDLVKTRCITPGNKKYRFTGTYPSGTAVFDVWRTIPDSANYRIDWR
jgi:hypothetical protein